jgi:pyrroloquinoline quinone biosynthesis protein D
MSEPVLSLESVPSLQRQYRFQYEEAQQCYVLLYPEGLIKLPGGSGEIIKRVDGQTSVAGIIQNLQETFPGVDLRQDVIDFLEVAYGKGWIRVTQH